MFRILRYTPYEGEQGILITVHTYFHNPHPTLKIFIRLLVGSMAVATKIQRAQVLDGEEDLWRLEGMIPRFDSHRSPSQTVTVSVQALDRNNTILDHVTFGEFTYWESGPSQSGI